MDLWSQFRDLTYLEVRPPGPSLPSEPSAWAAIDRGTGIDSEVLPAIFEFGMTTKGEEGDGWAGGRWSAL
jgi:hypothetical protein